MPPALTCACSCSFLGNAHIRPTLAVNRVQGVPLFSMDYKVFLWVQNDGNLVLYNMEAFHSYGATRAAAIWGSQTYGAMPQPFALAMQPVRSRAPAECVA